MSILGNFLDNHDNARFLNGNSQYTILYNALVYLVFAQVYSSVYYTVAMVISNRAYPYYTMVQNKALVVVMTLTTGRRYGHTTTLIMWSINSSVNPYTSDKKKEVPYMVVSKLRDMLMINSFLSLEDRYVCYSGCMWVCMFVYICGLHKMVDYTKALIINDIMFKHLHQPIGVVVYMMAWPIHYTAGILWLVYA